MTNQQQLKTAVVNLNTLLNGSQNLLGLNDQEYKDVKEALYFTIQHYDKFLEEGKAKAPEKTKAFVDRINAIYNEL